MRRSGTYLVWLELDLSGWRWVIVSCIANPVLKYSTWCNSSPAVLLRPPHRHDRKYITGFPSRSTLEAGLGEAHPYEALALIMPPPLFGFVSLGLPAAIFIKNPRRV